MCTAWFVSLQVPGGALAGLGSPANSMNSGMSGASPSIARSSPRMDLAAGGPVPPSLTPIVEGNTPAASRASLSSQQSQQAEGASGGWPGVHMSEADVVLDEDDNLEQDGGTLREQVAAEGPIMELTQREGCVSTAQRMGFSGAAAVGSGMGVSTPQSKGPRPQGLQTTPTSHQPSGDARMARLHSLLSPAAMQVSTGVFLACTYTVVLIARCFPVRNIKRQGVMMDVLPRLASWSVWESAR